PQHFNTSLTYSQWPFTAPRPLAAYSPWPRGQESRYLWHKTKAKWNLQTLISTARVLRTTVNATAASGPDSLLSSLASCCSLIGRAQRSRTGSSHLRCC